MNNQSLKLVQSINLYDNSRQKFIIQLNSNLGQGYFGTVKKAISQSNPYFDLAVKIIPYNGDQQQRQTFNKQIKIISNLGSHPNLIKVIPEKCWSQNNFYIFMEYCNQGTLQQKIKSKLINKQNFTQPQIFTTFYQLLSGYKVLWKKKILHQDLKPQNILIKDGIHKITDFGFSIFHQGVKFDKKRQGTLEYMPIQKLTKANYAASTKSDVYSMGVIFFKMITGRHPYILRPYQDDGDFIDQLKLAVLRPPTYVRARMSLAMQHLFDLILKMVQKKDTDRIDFDQVYTFIEEEQTFLYFGRNLSSMSKFVQSQQVKVPQLIQRKIQHIVQYSKAFAIPFSLLETDEQQYEQKIKNINIENQQRIKEQKQREIYKYLCSKRMMVYFFDRLSRKLTVQLKKQNYEENQVQLMDKIIFYLIFLSYKIAKKTIQDSKTQVKFSTSQWNMYRQIKPNVLDLIQNDQQYLKQQKDDKTINTQQSKIKQIHQMIEQSKKPLKQFMSINIRPQLLILLEKRSSLVQINIKQQLTTINYLLTGIDIIDNFEQNQQKWEELQSYFRLIQTQQLHQLRQKVYQGLSKFLIQASYIQGDWQDSQTQQLI